jgi:hypothetical protein
MERIGKNGFWMVCTAGLCALLMLNSALAAPPPNRQMQNLTQRLDLSVPTHAIESSEKSSAFPSMAHRDTLETRETIQLPKLGSDAMSARPSIQDLARRVRSEGLPVARLWESKAALVHLGFNQKGKPGLWIVQKTH